MSNIAIYQEGYNDGYNAAKSKYERPQGKWIIKNYQTGDILQPQNKKAFECFNCATHWDMKTNFCPNCGADMRGTDHE